MLVEDPRKRKPQDSLFSHNQEKEIEPLTLRIADPFRRIGAVLINILPVPFFFFYGIYYDSPLLELFVLVWLFFQIILMLFLRQTFGKWVMKIKVVNIKTRRNISFCNYLIREIVGIIFYVIFPFNIIVDSVLLLRKGDLYTFSRNIVSSAVVSTYLTNDV